MQVDGLRFLYPKINYLTIKDIEPTLAQMVRENSSDPTTQDTVRCWQEYFMDKERTKNKKSFAGWNFKRNPLLTVDLTPMSFPVSDEDLDETHFRFIRARNWYGIGKWLIAEDCFYKALEIGLYTNNMTFVFVCLASMCLNYLAGNEINETRKIINALSEIESYEKDMSFGEKYFTIELMALANLEKWQDINVLKKQNKQFKPYATYFNSIIEVFEFLAFHEIIYRKYIDHWNSLWEKINK